MKKLLLIIFAIFLSVVKAQDKKYLLFHNGYREFYIYTFQKEFTYKIERYQLNNEIELVETRTETFKNQEEENLYLKDAQLISSVKTDDIKEFDQFRNKPFKVIDKREKTSYSYCFYGSLLLTDNVQRQITYSGHITQLLYQENYGYKLEEDASKYSLKYAFQKVEGINFFIVDGNIYLFRAKDLLKNMFRNSDVLFIDKKFATLFNAQILKITKKTIGDKIVYGVNDDQDIAVLIPSFEKIMVCADAILAKENGLWYFYDFYGNKLIEKGYRKILPTRFNPNFIRHRPTYDGLLMYVVLDGNEIKTVDEIYKKSKTSKFINNLRDFAVCGARMGMSRSEYVNFEFNEKEFTLNNKVFYYGVSSFHPPLASNEIRMENKYSFLNPFEGVSSINKDDENVLFQKSTASKPMTVVLKRKTKENRFIPFFLVVSEESKELPFYHVDYLGLTSQQNNSNSNSDDSYDDILDLKADLPMLSLGGTYYSSRDFSNSNISLDRYYKLKREGKLGLYSPRSTFINDVEIKYKKLDDLTMRFSRFEDENGKVGWLSEDGEEFYDL
ncbi:hypothetical protein [Chryseobacterium viscerum]|uniref:DKNYY family protein n=1 Tax=Chryseobacterium viscerum TaxID=1037377 RepID=A0A5N4BL16_9FLAO|nr:hypothetical protein [Chryseobacterium viscerum]KAB1229103.1 hypothetical protein F8D52_19205 [Chryseobacterium viscerum]